MNTRSIKVSRGFNNARYKPRPFIRLCGKYLKEMGFEIGDYVEITGGNGVITITNYTNFDPREAETGSAGAQPVRNTEDGLEWSEEG